MVLDPNKELPGSHVQKGDEWFTAIDFSRLNFKQAVSVTGSWSGSNFNVKVSLWGVLDKTVNMSGSANISAGTVTSCSGDNGDNSAATATLALSVGGSVKTIEKQSFNIDASVVYNAAYKAGWNACRRQALNSARTLTYYLPTGDGDYVRDSCTLYTIPSAKS